METWMLGVGFIVALFVIWRFATKKTRPARRGGGVIVRATPVAVGHGGGQRRQGATFGTFILVNIICSIGSIFYVVVYTSGTRDGWWLFGALAALFGFPVIGMKVLEAAEPGERYSLFGCLIGICILAWLLAMPWFVFGIVEDINGK